MLKVFSKQNSKSRIHSKPDRNQSKLSVCISKVQLIFKGNFCVFKYFLVDLKTPKSPFEINRPLIIRDFNIETFSFIGWLAKIFIYSVKLVCSMSFFTIFDYFFNDQVEPNQWIKK